MNKKGTIGDRPQWYLFCGAYESIQICYNRFFGKVISNRFLCFLYYSVLIQYRFPNSFGAMTMNEKLTYPFTPLE